MASRTSSGRARRAGRAGSQSRLDQLPAAGHVSRAEVVIGGLHRPLATRVGPAGWRQPRGLLCQRRRFFWRASRRRVPGGVVEHPGDLLAGSVRRQGQMPGAVLDVLGDCRQPLVHLLAFRQRHLGIQDGPQERMGEPQHVTVTFDDALVDRLVDRRPGLPVVASRADQPFPRVGGGGDQPAHPPDIRSQPPQRGAAPGRPGCAAGEGAPW